MFRRLLNFISSPPRPTKLTAWAARVKRIVCDPPGCDNDSTDESLAASAWVDFTGMSAWAIVCEEVLDTSHSTMYYQRGREVLNRRGITDAEYEEMRRFDWMTAGRLNFEKMLWDWIHLDQSDILRALKWQFHEGLISKSDYHRFVAYTKSYEEGMYPRREVDVFEDRES